MKTTEAIQLTPENRYEVFVWVANSFTVEVEEANEGLLIGETLAKYGDYIVRDIEGKFISFGK